jgi:phage terminase large subunit-like protein
MYNSKARFKVCAAGRRFGKSHYAACMLSLEALRDVNESGHTLTGEHGVYYVAPTFDMAKRILWPKLRQLLGFEISGGFIRNENVNDGWLELINGRRIYIRGADNPDSLRGIALSYVVLDEYADMKANVWSEIIEPALMDVEGNALFIGTPKGKNHFYRIFMGALEKPVDPRTQSNVYWADWEAFHFKSGDNPFLKQKELQRIMGVGSTDVIRQEIEASFISGGGRVINPDWFPIVPKAPVYTQGNVFVTVDLAGFRKQEGSKVLRSDESVIAEVLVVEDEWYILNVQHGHWDVRETALRIARTLRNYTMGCRLGIEQGALKEAVGPYLEEYMREFDRFVTPEPLRHGGAKKADRISWALQGRGERKRIKLLKGAWNDHFLTQCSDFPDPLAHDDVLDAVAYVDQMSQANYVVDTDIEEWVPLDMDSGY